MDFGEELDDAASRASIVRISRTDIERGNIDAYVVDRNSDLVLLLVIDDKIEFDGFYVIRLADITNLEHPSPTWEFQEKALRLSGQNVDEAPEVDLSNFGTVVKSAGELFSCITIHRENIDPDVCFIGRVSRAGEKSFKLQHLTPDAEWEEELTTHEYSDLTRVDFGGKYEAALLLVGGAPTI